MRALGAVAKATEVSIKAAAHLGTLDTGAVEVLRHLARSIDATHQDLTNAVDDDPDGKSRSLDNVTVPTYLKYCEALGLTPSGRLRLDVAAGKKESTGGKLGKLQAVPRPRRSA